jgi:type II secretory pathway component PulM
VIAVVLVGAWLLVAKPLSNKKTEVAVEQPLTENKEDKKASDSSAAPDDKAASGSSSDAAGSDSNLAMPSELTTTGPGVNLALVGLIAGVGVYLLLLKAGARAKS